MTSVNTNSSATTALRTLQQTNKALETTQNKISTGLKIGEAKDNAAYWAISTTLKSDNKSLSTVKDALGLGAATVDVAYQGLNKSKEVLEEIQKKLTAATQDGVDRTIIQSEINELKKQLTAIAGASTFSGENWLSVDSSAQGYNGTKQLVSSFSRSSANAVSIGTIGVETGAIKLYDASATADGVLDTKVALKKADGTSLSYGGFAAVAGPSTTALNFSGTATGSAGNSPAAGKVELGTLNMAGVTKGDVITFSLNVDGTSNTVRLATSDLAANGSDFAAKLQLAVDGAVGANKGLVKVGGSVTGTSGVISIEAVGSTGTSSTVTAGPIAVLDGDGTVTGTAGILGASSLPGPAFGDATKATSAVGTFAAQAKAAQVTNFTAGNTTALNELITFDLTYGDVTKAISVDLGAIGAKSATAVAGLMQTAINNAFTSSTYRGVTYTANDIVVATDMSKIESKFTGASQKVGIANVAGAGATSLAFTAGAVTAGTGANLAVGDKVAFNVQYGSTVVQISHEFEALDFAGGGIANGWAAPGRPTADEWKTFLQTKIDTAFRTGGAAGVPLKFNGDPAGASYANGDVVVKNTNGALSIESKNSGKDQAVGLTGYTATLVGTAPTGANGRFGLSANSSAASGGAVGYGNATAPTQVIGTFSDTAVNLGANDRISMTVNVGGSQKTISIATDGMLPYASGANTLANAATFQAKVQNALDGAFGGNVVKFTAIDTGNGSNMTLKTVATGTTAYLAISNVTAQDGNGTASNAGGLTAGLTNTGAVGAGQNVGMASTATLVSGTTFNGPMTINANDTISFNVAVDGVSKSVNVDRSRVDAVLTPGANGVIANGSDYAAVLNSAFTAAGVAVTVTAPSNVLTFTRNGGAAAGTVAVTGVTSSGGSSTMSVDNIDLTASAFTSLTATQKKEVLASYISVVNTAIKSVTTAASELGSVSSRIALQQSFVDTLMDTIDKGVGNLVDADLSEESTRLQALQTKQQLGVQALSIANQSTQNILRLFQ